MALVVTQLRALLWRNFLIKKRNWKRSVLEVLIPVVLLLIIVLISFGVRTNRRAPVPQFLPLNITSAPLSFLRGKSIIASPALPFAVDVMDSVNKALNGTSFLTNYSVTSTKADMEYKKQQETASVGVELLYKNFSGMLSVDGYVLRLPYEQVRNIVPECPIQENLEKCSQTDDGLSPECPGSEALRSGLFSLQWAVETALIQTFQDPDFKPPALQVQMMPMPAFRPGATNIQLMVSVCMVLAMAPLACYITVTMATEKKNWAKVALSLMGLRDSLFLLSWWLVYMIVVLLVAIAAAVLLLVDVLATPGLGFLLLMAFLYGASLLCLGCIVSVSISTPKIAGLTASILSILMGLPYLSVSLTRPSAFTSTAGSDSHMTQSAVPLGGQIVLSLFSPTAFALGVDQIIYDQEEGNKSGFVTGQFPLVAAILMLVLDTALYGVLAIYLDCVVPNPTRLPHKPWFCLTPSYWRKRHDDLDNDVTPTDTPEGPHIERVCDALSDRRTIRIWDLCKKFNHKGKDPSFGLNGLDLDIYEGQITCILGHSGSGKTTLLNILAGVIAPSSGVAFIQNLNVSSIKDHKDLAKIVGYCPQSNVLHGHLSVGEHLNITAVMRDVESDDIEHQIQSCLKDFRLDKEKQKVRELSGCQKRRLSLAIALLGNNKVVLLDEPTLGMEPAERRHLWTLLHARKDRRTIVFTSKHMDEADYFSDRTAVLSRGRLRCVGSSDFLKEHFSVGYRLSVKVRPATNTDRLMRAVKAHVRGANLVRCVDNTLTITIPLLQAGKLTALFRQLESKDKGGEYLGVIQFGISLMTLEQVFCKLGEEEESGNVFISPLLTPSTDTLPDFGLSQTGDSPRLGSMFTSSSPRSSALLAQQNSTRRLSSHAQLSNKRLDTGERRKSAFPILQQRSAACTLTVNEDERVYSKPGNFRKLSHLFIERVRRTKLRRGSDDDPLSSHTEMDKPKHAAHFAHLFHKQHKGRSNSFALESLKNRHSSHSIEIEDQVMNMEEKPAFIGTVLPPSLAERRATVAAFEGLRSVAQHRNFSSTVGLGDQPSLAKDPMAKLDLLDAFEQVRKTSFANVVTDTSPPVAEKVARDPESVHVHPIKFSEVLDNIKPPKQGNRLMLQRLSAMLKLHVLLCFSSKLGLLLRVATPLVLTLLAVGLSCVIHSTLETYMQTGQRIPLFGASRLVYRNQSGANVDHLLANIREIPVSEQASNELNPSLEFESLLDILEADGSAFSLHYKASCGLSLFPLVSLLARVLRDSAGPIINNSNNMAFLAPNVSAWLQPWPAVTPNRVKDRWQWVPVLLLGLALILTPLTFAARLLKERETNMRSYLGVTGVSRTVYYGSAFTANVIEFLVSAGLLVVICATTGIRMFEGEGAVYTLLLLVVLCGIAGVLWAYVASFVFSRASSCFLFLMPLVTLVTLGGFFLVYFLDDGDTMHIATALHYVFTILWTPYIPFGALHYIADVRDKGKGAIHATYYFLFDSKIDICFIMLAGDVVVLSFLLLALDKRTFGPSNLLCNSSKKRQLLLDSHCQKGDDSVSSEMQYVTELQKNECGTRWPKLVIDRLTKVFSRKGQRVRAVDSTTLTVKQGDVLGLLGPAGAGKSTLLDMVLGACSSSDGSVYIDSDNVNTLTPSGLSEKFGYCPEYNPLWESLTVDQHINLIGAFRGLHQKDIDSFRASLYHDLDLNAYRSQKAMRLSECERRKLSFAMSMLGTQTIMFLDEPSAGMNSRSRHLYWDAVTYFLKASQRSAIISTRCMDEAQALCSRFAVMVNGQLRCIGTPEELKVRFGHLYTLEVTLRGWTEESGPQRMDMLIMFLRELFPDLLIVEQVQQRAVFRVHCSTEDFSLANTFNTLESLKRNLDLEDFTFSQTDLDKTFLNLAREQKEGDSQYMNRTTNSHTSMVNGKLKITTDQERVPPETQRATTLGLAPPTSSGVAGNTESEGGASCQDPITEAHAAVGVVLHCHHGDNNGGGVAGEEKVARAEAGAAATVVGSVEGVVNLAYMADEEGGQLEIYL